MPSLRVHRASDEFARDLVARISRWLFIGLGLALMLIAVPLVALPGHLGLPLMVVGLMIVLRNSFKAKRQFLRLQYAHPKMVFPIRRLMRRDPEIIPVMWQQYLRMERLVLPSRARFAVKSRRYLRHRFGKTQAA